MTDHERIEELIAVSALGGLDPDDEQALRREMAGHGADCAECARLESEYAEVAGRLAFAVDPLPVPKGFEDEVLAVATADRRKARPVIGPRPNRAWSRSGRLSARLRPLVAIAASLVLFVAGWALGSRSSEEPVPEGARVVAFEGESGARLSMAYRVDHAGVYLLGSNLEPPPEGHVYEVWMFQQGTPVPATCFTPGTDGSVFAFVDAELGTTDAMAVTVEPSSCPSAPTSAPILTAQISA